MTSLFTGVEVSFEEFKTHVEEIFSSLQPILIQKNKEYGGASFQDGVLGNVFRLGDKYTRYKTWAKKAVESKETALQFESVEDTLRDVIGYATIGLLILKKLEEARPLATTSSPQTSFAYMFDREEQS